MTAIGVHVCEGCGALYDTIGPYLDCKEQHQERVVTEVTESDTLTAAIRELRERPTGLPRSCNELIVQIMEELAKEITEGGDEHQFSDLGEAVVLLACAIAGEAARSDRSD